MKNFAFVILTSILLSLPLGSNAQELFGVQEQIDALKDEMMMLSRKVYRDNLQAPLASGAHEAVKLGEYDETIRNLNGKVDMLEHQLKQLEEKFNTLNNDIDVRFKLLEGKPIPAAANSIETPKKFDAAIANGAPRSITGDDITTSSLKNLSPSKQNLSVDELYTKGLEALKAGQTAEAEQEFLLILDKYPSDKLAGNAQYWLGEVYYKDKNFAKAAVAFGKGYEKYKNGSKSAGSLLKLGLSMEQLGKKQEACLAFKNLPVEFPKAEAVVKQKAAAEAKKLGCK